LEQEANVEHPSLAKLEREKKKLFLDDLAKRVYVHDKTSLKITGAESQRGQPKGVFQTSR
jgi:hypothetical protein